MTRLIVFAHLRRYFEIERWGRHPRQIYSDLTPQSWWREGGGFDGANDCNALRGMDSSDGQFHALIQRWGRSLICDPIDPRSPKRS